MKVALFVLLAFAALLLVSGGYIFVLACVRRKELPWLEEEIKQTAYGKYYDNIRLGDRFLREHNATVVETLSYDGLKLSAHWVPAENPKGTILFAHGYRSSKLVDFSLAFEFYHKQGMNILAPDQRAHGKSEGRLITFGVKESRDMQSWVVYHNCAFGTYPVILSGLSMGASTMLYLADADLPPNVKGIIADCGFTSPYEIIKSVFERVIHLPAAPTLWVTNFFTRIFAGFGLREKDTRNSLKNSKIPVFMIHGTADGFVPCEMTQKGFDACTGEKKLLLAEGAEHGTSFLVQKEKYTAMICDFLKQNVEDIQ